MPRQVRSGGTLCNDFRLERRLRRRAYPEGASGRAGSPPDSEDAMTERSHRSDRDVAAFAQRAGSYESGWRGQLHHEITARTAALAAEVAGAPHRILDVGCGTGQLL